MWKIFISLVLLGAAQANGQTIPAAFTPDGPEAQTRHDVVRDAPVDLSYLGKPFSYWLKSIQNRDDEMNLAFEAIRHLGPAASSAVPELTRIVSEPFTPIEIGVDGHGAVTSRLLQIQLHSNAVDCLAAIGRSAASSATALTDWALATKVILRNARNRQDQDAFVDLVGIDVLERMRVAGAIAQFTPDASLVIAGLLKSPDGEARKLGVSILSERALPIATGLLKADNCTAQKLGLKMLTDMWPVVAKDHLLDLDDMLACAWPLETGAK